MLCSAKDGTNRKTKGLGIYSIWLQVKKSVSIQHARSWFPSYTIKSYFSTLFLALRFCKPNLQERGRGKHFWKVLFQLRQENQYKKSCLLFIKQEVLISLYKEHSRRESTQTHEFSSMMQLKEGVESCFDRYESYIRI